MPTSASDYDAYRNICKMAATNDTVYSSFRRSHDYNIILENVPKEIGQKCLDILIEAKADNIEPLSYVDDIGMPIMFNYGKYGSWSPTTLRYIKIYLEFLSMLDLNGAKIIEVGGGYGGQANIIKHNHEVDYHIYDLPEPLMLTKRYLAEFDREIIPHNVLDGIEENSCDLFISNCAISEINKEYQDEYLIKIIPNSKHGYITYNTFSNAYPVDIFFNKVQSAHKKANKFQENPLSGQGNQVIIW